MNESVLALYSPSWHTALQWGKTPHRWSGRTLQEDCWSWHSLTDTKPHKQTNFVYWRRSSTLMKSPDHWIINSKLMALTLLRSWTSANYCPAIYRPLHQTWCYTRLSHRGGCRSDKLLEEQDVSDWAADQRGSRVHYSLTALRTMIAETQSSLNLHTRHKHTQHTGLCCLCETSV